MLQFPIDIYTYCVYNMCKKGVEKLSKVRVNISIEPDTHERIKQYAFENHMNVSQAITKLIWDANVKNAQLKGQMSFAEVK